jgi:hypothetical protein
LIRIAVDAMGGDNAPVEIIKGAVSAAKEFPFQIILVGQEAVIKKELSMMCPRAGIWCMRLPLPPIWGREAIRLPLLPMRAAPICKEITNGGILP